MIKLSGKKDQRIRVYTSFNLYMIIKPTIIGSREEAKASWRKPKGLDCLQMLDSLLLLPPGRNSLLLLCRCCGHQSCSLLRG